MSNEQNGGDDPELGLTEEEREELRAAFQEIPLHKLLDVRRVELGEDSAVFEMPVAPAAFNPSGNLHGGAIATLIDITSGTAAALGSHTFEPGRNTLVTADMHVRYLGRATGDVIRASAKVMRSGNQLVVVECKVHDPATGKLIAIADFAAMVVGLREPLRETDFGDTRNPDY